MMGIEAVKSSTPAVCRKEMKNLFKIIMTGNQKKTQNTIADFRAKFSTMNPAQVAFPRGCGRLDDYAVKGTIYRKGCPKHMRAALLYNSYLITKGVDAKYSKIRGGNKIRYVELRVPNSMGRENVIGFPAAGDLPPEFDLHRFVDYDVQFNKSFVEPLEMIFNAIGWTVEDCGSLEEFFG
jgi:hypothetical protein